MVCGLLTSLAGGFTRPVASIAADEDESTSLLTSAADEGSECVVCLSLASTTFAHVKKPLFLSNISFPLLPSQPPQTDLLPVDLVERVFPLALPGEEVEVVKLSAVGVDAVARDKRVAQRYEEI